jgi:hypothetical protein
MAWWLSPSVATKLKFCVWMAMLDSHPSWENYRRHNGSSLGSVDVMPLRRQLTNLAKSDLFDLITLLADISCS